MTRRRAYTCADCGHAITQRAERRHASGACPVCLGSRWIRGELLPAPCAAPCDPPCDRPACASGLCAWHADRLRRGLSVYARPPERRRS